MDLKPWEIVQLVFAIAAPTIFLVLAFIPGGLNWVGDIALHPAYRNWLFFGGAAIAFAFLAFRIYRRIRPRAKKKEETPHVSPTHWPKV